MTRATTGPGHEAASWSRFLHDLPSTEVLGLLGLAAGDRLVVTVPHPDDETLALGGVLVRLARAGVELTLVSVTDGEAAYGDTGEAAARLAATRRDELDAALGALGVEVDVRRLGLPDGRVERHEQRLLADLTDVLADVLAVVAGQPAGAQPRTVVLAPWPRDPHPDHRAVGRASAAAARRAGVDRWSYPVWLRYRHAPDDPAVPWSTMRRVELDPDELARKRRAISAYASQLDGPSDEVGPVLPQSVVEHFVDGNELLLAPAPSSADALLHFESMYEGADDPWAAQTSWYERRKRAVLLASLPRERYAVAWEPGCSIGDVTLELAGRCDQVASSDVAPTAVARAAGRVAHLPNVRVEVALMPGRPPFDPASADLVVLSELLYYLDPAARAATLDRADTVLAADGHLVVAHWRGHPSDAHCSGEHANREVVERFEHHLVHHVDEHFVLDVVGRRRTAAPGG